MQHIVAQKVSIVNRSPLTGIGLPDGSKLDKRILYVAAAEILLEAESKKNGVHH